MIGGGRMPQLPEEIASVLNKLTHNNRDGVVAEKLLEASLLEFEAKSLAGDTKSLDEAREKVHARLDAVLDAKASQHAIIGSVTPPRETGAKQSSRIWMLLDAARDLIDGAPVWVRLQDNSEHKARARVEDYRTAMQPMMERSVSVEWINERGVPIAGVQSWAPRTEKD